MRPVDSWSPVFDQARGSLRRATRHCLNLGLNLVFPPACAVCQAELDGEPGPAICAACHEQLVDMRAACPRCGSTRQFDTSQQACLHCRDLKLHFVRTLRLGTYDGLMRTVVLRMKRPHDRALAQAVGELLADRTAPAISEHSPDVIIPVPMHWSRLLWRGANSPLTIGERIAARYRIPLVPQLLARCRRTIPQANLSPRQRRANVRGAFRVRSHRDLLGARVLLVDDILTTGATLNEAARVLTQAGAGEISVAVLARAEGPV